MQDPRTLRFPAWRGPLWWGLWLGGTVLLALLLFALRLPANQVIAFTLCGASLGGLMAFTLKISLEDGRKGHGD